MADRSVDYKKQVAVIVPRWCLNMLLDHLDMQYESLLQEQEFYHSLGDAKQEKDLEEDLRLYSDAVDQIVGQLDNS